MLFSMKTLLINPNIIAVENIDDPPRLRSGKGIPVNGIKPRIVNMFISTVSYTHLTLQTICSV